MSLLRPLIVKKFTDLQPYEATIDAMERAVDARALSRDHCELWLLEHAPIITCGATTEKDFEEFGIPVVSTGRGGKATYHGPGQRIGYVIMPLDEIDLRGYIHRLEEWLITTLATFGVVAFQRVEGHGVWVNEGHGMAKIAAIGVRVRKRIAYHGVALNVSNNLHPCTQFRPCGLALPATSLEKLGVNLSLSQVDAALLQCFRDVFPVR